MGVRFSPLVTVKRRKLTYMTELPIYFYAADEIGFLTKLNLTLFHTLTPFLTYIQPHTFAYFLQVGAVTPSYHVNHI